MNFQTRNDCVQRLESKTVSDLTNEQREVLDAINSGPRGGSGDGVGLIGPYGVWVRAPKVGHAIQNLGAVARFETNISEAVKEIAICVVGAHHRAKFEFAAHARLAIKAGIDPESVEAIRCGAVPALDGPVLISYEVAKELVDSSRLAQNTYEDAITAFGEVGLIELVSVIGYYVLVSYSLNAFQVPILDSMTDPFPEVD